MLSVAICMEWMPGETGSTSWNLSSTNPKCNNNKNKLIGIYVCRHKHTLFFVVYLLLLGTTTCFAHQCWPSSGCTWGTYQ